MTEIPAADVVAKYKLDTTDGERGISRMKQGFGSLSDSLGPLLSNMSLVELTFGGIAAAALKASEDGATAFQRLQFNTGAVGNELQNLRDQMDSIARRADESFGDIGTAVELVHIRLQLAGDEAERLAEKYVSVADAFGADTAQFTSAGTAIQRAWNVGAESVDKFVVAKQRSGAAITELMAMMKEYGPILRSMNMGFDESLAMLANFEREGVAANKVMAAFKAGLKSAGGDEAKLGEMIRKIGDLSRAGDQQGATELASRLFGRNFTDVLDAINRGALDIREMQSAIEGAAGAADKLKEITLGAEISRTLNVLNVELRPMGELLANIVKEGQPLLRTLIGILTPINALVSSDFGGNLVKWGIGLAVVSKAIGPVSSGIAGLITMIKGLPANGASSLGNIFTPYTQGYDTIRTALIGREKLELQKAAATLKSAQADRTAAEAATQAALANTQYTAAQLRGILATQAKVASKLSSVRATAMEKAADLEAAQAQYAKARADFAEASANAAMTEQEALAIGYRYKAAQSAVAAANAANTKAQANLRAAETQAAENAAVLEGIAAQAGLTTEQLAGVLAEDKLTASRLRDAEAAHANAVASMEQAAAQRSASAASGLVSGAMSALNPILMGVTAALIAGSVAWGALEKAMASAADKSKAELAAMEAASSKRKTAIDEIRTLGKEYDRLSNGTNQTAATQTRLAQVKTALIDAMKDVSKELGIQLPQVTDLSAQYKALLTVLEDTKKDDLKKQIKEEEVKANEARYKLRMMHLKQDFWTSVGYPGFGQVDPYEMKQQEEIIKKAEFNIKNYKRLLKLDLSPDASDDTSSTPASANNANVEGSDAWKTAQLSALEIKAIEEEIARTRAHQAELADRSERLRLDAAARILREEATGTQEVGELRAKWERDIAAKKVDMASDEELAAMKNQMEVAIANAEAVHKANIANIQYETDAQLRKWENEQEGARVSAEAAAARLEGTLAVARAEQDISRLRGNLAATDDIVERARLNAAITQREVEKRNAREIADLQVRLINWVHEVKDAAIQESRRAQMEADLATARAKAEADTATAQANGERTIRDAETQKRIFEVGLDLRKARQIAAGEMAAIDDEIAAKRDTMAHAADATEQANLQQQIKLLGDKRDLIAATIALREQEQPRIAKMPEGVGKAEAQTAFEEALKGYELALASVERADNRAHQQRLRNIKTEEMAREASLAKQATYLNDRWRNVWDSLEMESYGGKLMADIIGGAFADAYAIQDQGLRAWVGYWEEVDRIEAERTKRYDDARSKYTGDQLASQMQIIDTQLLDRLHGALSKLTREKIKLDFEFKKSAWDAFKEQLTGFWDMLLGGSDLVKGIQLGLNDRGRYQQFAFGQALLPAMATPQWIPPAPMSAFVMPPTPVTLPSLPTPAPAPVVVRPEPQRIRLEIIPRKGQTFDADVRAIAEDSARNEIEVVIRDVTG
jgi:hypothetical protein